MLYPGCVAHGLPQVGRLQEAFPEEFAKKDRANIDDDELANLKKLAQAFGRMTEAELRSTLNQGDLLELCDEE